MIAWVSHIPWKTKRTDIKKCNKKIINKHKKTLAYWTDKRQRNRKKKHYGWGNFLLKGKEKETKISVFYIYLFRCGSVGAQLAPESWQAPHPEACHGLVADLLFLFGCFWHSCFNNKSKHQNINLNLEETKNTPNVNVEREKKRQIPNKCWTVLCGIEQFSSDSTKRWQNSKQFLKLSFIQSLNF